MILSSWRSARVASDCLTSLKKTDITLQSISEGIPCFVFKENAHEEILPHLNDTDSAGPVAASAIASAGPRAIRECGRHSSGSRQACERTSAAATRRQAGSDWPVDGRRFECRHRA